MSWNWGASEDFGRLWRICTGPTAANPNLCLADNKDLTLGGQVIDVRHAYDDVGNLINIRDYVNSNQVQTFGYDHLNRLTSAVTDAVGADQYDQYFAYNKLGNITSFDGAGFGYSSAHKHAISSDPTVAYSYDLNGNMTLRNASGTANDYTQNFNVENELTSVVNNGSTTTFAYDASGIRTKTVSPSNVTTYYPFPGYEEEVNGSTTTRRITYSAAGQAIALRVQIVSGSNTLYYLHSDHLGSTSLATDTNGVKITYSDSRYYPFGGWRTEPSANLTDRGFTGHLHNNIGSGPDDIGLVYMQARWFLPGVGRFASADTIVPDPTDPQSYNRYSYVRNQPLTRIDPTGHMDQSDSDGGGWDEDWDTRLEGTLRYFEDGVHEGLFNEYYSTVYAAEQAYAESISGGISEAEAINLEAYEAQKETSYQYALGHVNQNNLVAGMLSGVPNFGGVDEVLSGGGVATTSGPLIYEDPVVVNAMSGDCSFSAETLVTTEAGLVPISEVNLETLVLAYNEAIGETGYYPVLGVWAHEDPVIVYLTIDGEKIATTPNHPFFTVEGEWAQAGNLSIGDKIRDAAWGTATVEAITFTATPQTMYNFTVATAHTYFVGNGQWLVHNDCSPQGSGGGGQRFNSGQDALIQLAKEVKRGGLTTEQASILESWAQEYNIPFRGPESHPGRPFGQYPHIQVGPVNHIPVNP